MAVYRLPLFHCFLACLATLILGFGLGFTLGRFSPKPVTTRPVVTVTPTPTPSGIPDPTPTDGKVILTLYFDNILFNSNAASCSAVFPVKRQISVTNVPLRAALNLLFQGPTEQEQAFGYRSVFSSTTTDLLKSVNVKNGIVYLDFNRPAALEAVKSGANSSCGHAQFLSSIEKTAMSFSGIKTVDEKNFTLGGSKSAYLNLLQQ